MTDKAISPLRQRLIEDMAIRQLSSISATSKALRISCGRSPEKATAEDVHRYQLHLGSIGATVPTPGKAP